MNDRLVNLDLTKLANADSDCEITRRDAMRAAAALLVPRHPDSELEFLAGLDLQHDSRGWVLSQAGVVVWKLEAAAFAGQPTIHVSRQNDRLSLLLDEALLGGTSISAVTRCSIQPSNGVWTIAVELPGLGFSGRAPLREWLSGSCLLTGRVASWSAGVAANAGLLSLRAGAWANFSPDWKVEIAGAGAATLRVGGVRLRSDKLVLRALPGRTESLLAGQTGPRIVAHLERGRQLWKLFPGRIEDRGAALLANADSISQATFEAAGGRLELAAEAKGLDTIGEFRTAWKLASSEKEPFRIPLDRLRFIAALSAAGSEHTLWGYGSGETLRMNVGSASIDLHNTAGSPVVTWTRMPAGERLECAPQLLAVTVHTPDAFATTYAASTDRIFLHGGDQNTDVSVAPDPSACGCAEVSLPDFSTCLSRADDFLSLHFQFLNYRLRTSFLQAPKLVPIDATKAGTLIVHFPPQSTGEIAFFRTAIPGGAGDETPQSLPVKARLSHPSRVAFQIPIGVKEIPYRLDHLLRWTDFPINVAANAKTAGPREAVTTALAREVTALELPYRVVLSPDENAGWKHAVDPVTFKERTELWHTRLGVRKGTTGDYTVDDLDTGGRMLRAIYSPDAKDAPSDTNPDTSPFLMGLSSGDRNNIVHLSSDYSIPGYKPPPIPADLLMLTSAGAWLRSNAKWDGKGTGGTFTSLTAWTQYISGGRDTFTEVVNKGFLMPLGHPAVVLKQTERLPEQFPAIGTSPLAILQQRIYIVILKPDVTYGPFDLIMTKAHFKKLITPPLDNPRTAGGVMPLYFWPRVNGSDYLFDIEGTDFNNGTVSFSMPLIFLAHDHDPPTGLTGAMTEYSSLANLPRRTRSLARQRMAVAKPANAQQTETSLDVINIEFGVEAVPQPPGSESAPFRPLSPRYQASAPSLQMLLGNTDGCWFKPYNPEDPNNKGEVFAQVDSSGGVIEAKFSDSADTSGGVATPDTRVMAMTRIIGPVSSAKSDTDTAAFQNAVSNTFDPSKYFPPSANILGGIPLSNLFEIGDLSVAPKIQHLQGNRFGPGQVDSATITWKNKLKAIGGLIVPSLNGQDGTLSLDVTVSQTILPNNKIQSSRTYSGTLTNFELLVAGMLDIEFSKVTFSRKDQEKINFNLTIAGFHFTGILSFMAAFSDFLNFASPAQAPDTQKDPNATKPAAKSGITLSVGNAGVTIGYELHLPNLPLGIFSLSNIAFSAGCILPFDNNPMKATFGFASKAAPFLLTISIFGGQGYFALEFVPRGADQGITRLEACLEFGGFLTINIAGVIKGAAYAVGGVYYLKTTSSFDLKVYFRFGGYASLLGIVTVCLDVYLGLDDASTCSGTNLIGRFSGMAQVTFSISILFFSWSFTATFEKTFEGSTQKVKSCPGGGLDDRDLLLAAGRPGNQDTPTAGSPVTVNSDLTIESLMSAAEWKEYWEAFAI